MSLDTLPYYNAYRKAKHRDSYFRKHKSEIILHGGAKHMLEQHGVSLKSLNPEKPERKISELESWKKELSSDYKTLAKSEKDVRKQVEKLKGYLDVESEKGFTFIVTM